MRTKCSFKALSLHHVLTSFLYLLDLVAPRMCHGVVKLTASKLRLHDKRPWCRTRGRCNEDVMHVRRDIQAINFIRVLRALPPGTVIREEGIHGCSRSKRWSWDWGVGSSFSFYSQTMHEHKSLCILKLCFHQREPILWCIQVTSKYLSSRPIYVQLLDPETNCPFEFSHPQTPVCGSLIHPAPSPQLSPLSSQKKVQ